MSTRGLSRAELAAEVARLRADGLTHRAVADRLGISRSYAAELRTDPIGEKSRARKASYAQPCVDCGAPTSGSEGRREEPRCPPCAAIVAGAARTIWTRARIIAAIQWWNDQYGEPPAVCDWGKYHATTVGDRDRCLRAKRHMDTGEIPCPATVIRAFGSWNSGIRAAGFEPRQPNGGGGNQLRRRAKVAA